MAEFQEVIRQKERMCKSFARCEDGCPFNEVKICSDSVLTEHPQKSEEIIMKWAEEHPTKTNADKFREVFGVAPDTTICVFVDNPTVCDKCEHVALFPFECPKAWWNNEYKEPKAVE